MHTTTEPALNVVIYAEPGPAEAELEAYSHGFVLRKSVWGHGGGLGCMVLVREDFNRLWRGVDRGDLLGTAWCVLRHLGPSAQIFIGRLDDFMFGWIGEERDRHGRVLLLQVVPREHTVAAMATLNN